MLIEPLLMSTLISDKYAIIQAKRVMNYGYECTIKYCTYCKYRSEVFVLLTQLAFLFFSFHLFPFRCCHSESSSFIFLRILLSHTN